MVTKARERWLGQRYGARKRGIEFCFTFEEWVKWWEDHLGPDWMERRGRHKGQFQMARNGDEGSYADWNVKCLTVEDNVKDQLINGHVPSGEKHCLATLTDEQVRAIYTADDFCIRQTAKTLGVPYNTIAQIRCGQSWRNVTEGLKAGARCHCRGRRGCRRGYRKRGFTKPESHR